MPAAPAPLAPTPQSPAPTMQAPAPQGPPPVAPIQPLGIAATHNNPAAGGTGNPDVAMRDTFQRMFAGGGQPKAAAIERLYRRVFGEQ